MRAVRSTTVAASGPPPPPPEAEAFVAALQVDIRDHQAGMISALHATGVQLAAYGPFLERTVAEALAATKGGARETLLTNLMPLVRYAPSYQAAVVTNMRSKSPAPRVIEACVRIADLLKPAVAEQMGTIVGEWIWRQNDTITASSARWHAALPGSGAETMRGSIRSELLRRIGTSRLTELAPGACSWFLRTGETEAGVVRMVLRTLDPQLGSMTFLRRQDPEALGLIPGWMMAAAAAQPGQRQACLDWATNTLVSNPDLAGLAADTLTALSPPPSAGT